MIFFRILHRGHAAADGDDSENDSGPAFPDLCGVLCGLGTLESKGLAVRNVWRCLCAVLIAYPLPFGFPDSAGRKYDGTAFGSEKSRGRAGQYFAITIAVRISPVTPTVTIGMSQEPFPSLRSRTWRNMFCVCAAARE